MINTFNCLIHYLITSNKESNTYYANDIFQVYLFTRTSYVNINKICKIVIKLQRTLYFLTIIVICHL